MARGVSAAKKRGAPRRRSGSAFEQLFQLRAAGTTVRTEVVAGLTTFLVMSYIIFVNPLVLSFSGAAGLEGKGLPFAATMTATCLTSGLLTIAMGLVANYPYALAAGMGLNAVVGFQLVAGMGLTWPEAMGLVFLEGLIITILVMTGLRTAIMDAIPIGLKRAIGVGIGLFILFIGLVNGDIVQRGEATVVTLGKLSTIPVLVTILGFFLTVGLMALRVRAALLLGIVGATILATALNYASGLTAYTTPGWAVLPTQSLAPPDFSTLGKFDPFGAFVRVGPLAAALAVYALMLSDFFDTMGTITGIGSEAGFIDDKGRMPRLRQVLLIDSLGALFGGAASASTNTTYIESSAGVQAGGRTGLTAVVVGILFLLALFFNPLVAMVPKESMRLALILVGFLMAGIVTRIPFDNLDEGLPALLTIVAMPLTWSISNGIGLGFITYVFIKLVRRQFRAVHPLLYVTAAAFLLYFGLDVLRSVFRI